MMLILKEPSLQHLPSLISGINEYKNDTTVYHISTVRKMMEAHDKGDIASYMHHIDMRKRGMEEGRVPTTTLWLLEGGTYVGTYQIRHYLNKHLFNTAGHIAFEIIPSKRGKGYALQGAKLALRFSCIHLNINKALLTCSEDNKASYAVIKKLMRDIGGEEIPPYIERQHKERRVWVPCCGDFPPIA